MRYQVVKDRKRRRKFLLNEKKRKSLKVLQTNKFLPGKVRLLATNELRLEESYSVRIKNYCTLTSRSRGIVREFKLSRMCFKQYANLGYFTGVKKASW